MDKFLRANGPTTVHLDWLRNYERIGMGRLSNGNAESETPASQYDDGLPFWNAKDDATAGWSATEAGRTRRWTAKEKGKGRAVDTSTVKVEASTEDEEDAYLWTSASTTHEELAAFEEMEDADLRTRILAGAVFTSKDKGWMDVVAEHRKPTRDEKSVFQGPIARGGIKLVRTAEGSVYAVNHLEVPEEMPYPGPKAYLDERNWITRYDEAYIHAGLGWKKNVKRLKYVLNNPHTGLLWAKMKGKFKAKDSPQVKAKLQNAGYFGPPGAKKIAEILYCLPSDSRGLDFYNPFTRKEFIDLILVPEAAVLLMRRRFQIENKEALDLLEKSKDLTRKSSGMRR